jgi:hypothetical protein
MLEAMPPVAHVTLVLSPATGKAPVTAKVIKTKLKIRHRAKGANPAGGFRVR